MSVAPEI